MFRSDRVTTRLVKYVKGASLYIFCEPDDDPNDTKLLDLL